MPRWWRWLHARIFGYFWMPCPHCGEEFGGHEMSAHPAFGFGKAVCWRCDAWAVDYSRQQGVEFVD